MFNSKIEVLSKKDLDSIHKSSLQVLRDVGVRVENERLLSMLRSIGCQVEKNGVVKFSESVIEEIIKEVRIKKGSKGEKFPVIEEALYSRPINVKEDINQAKFYASGQSLYAHDIDTNNIRPATGQDLINATRLVAALPNIGLSHPVFIPQDVPQMVRDIHALEIVALNYPDSCCVELFSMKSLDYFVEIGTIIRGSMEELKKNPCFSYILAVDTPLRFSKGNLDIAFKLHDLGLKSSIGLNMVLPGANTPVTLAGVLVLQNAEILASNVINKVLNNELRSYCVIPAIMDMAVASSVQGAPEVSLLSLASIQLMKYYGFPLSGLGLFNTDSKLPDIQVGFEKAYSAILGLIAGVRSFASVGVLAGAQIASLIQIVIDAEFAGLVNRLLKGIECSKDNLALVLINKVGIGGNFLGEDHTVKHFRKELWFPELIDRRIPSSWLKDEKITIDKAKDKVKSLLKNYQSRPTLNKDKIREIKKVVKKADERIGYVGEKIN